MIISQTEIQTAVTFRRPKNFKFKLRPVNTDYGC
jgi:hypothetical protein